MAVTLREEWKSDIERRLVNSTSVINGRVGVFSTTESHPMTKQFVIAMLVRHQVPFKVIQNGCGVVTITTDTDTCPMCRRAYKEHK